MADGGWRMAENRKRKAESRDGIPATSNAEHRRAEWTAGKAQVRLPPGSTLIGAPTQTEGRLPVCPTDRGPAFARKATAWHARLHGNVSARQARLHLIVSARHASGRVQQERGRITIRVRIKSRN